MARPLRFRSAYLHGYMLGATVIFGFGEQFILDLYLQDLRDQADARGRFTMDAEGVTIEPPNQEGEK